MGNEVRGSCRPGARHRLLQQARTDALPVHGIGHLHRDLDAAGVAAVADPASEAHGSSVDPGHDDLVLSRSHRRKASRHRRGESRHTGVEAKPHGGGGELAEDLVDRVRVSGAQVVNRERECSSGHGCESGEGACRGPVVKPSRSQPHRSVLFRAASGSVARYGAKITPIGVLERTELA